MYLLIVVLYNFPEESQDETSRNLTLFASTRISAAQTTPLTLTEIVFALPDNLIYRQVVPIAH
jgi:hypothetical protein